MYQSGTNIGVNTTSPLAGFHAVSNASPVAFFDVYSNALGALPVVYRAARGTPASPAAVQANDILGGLAVRGYGTTGWSTGRGQVMYRAAENLDRCGERDVPVDDDDADRVEPVGRTGADYAGRIRGDRHLDASRPSGGRRERAAVESDRSGHRQRAHRRVGWRPDRRDCVRARQRRGHRLSENRRGRQPVGAQLLYRLHSPNGHHSRRLRRHWHDVADVPSGCRRHHDNGGRLVQLDRYERDRGRGTRERGYLWLGRLRARRRRCRRHGTVELRDRLWRAVRESRHRTGPWGEGRVRPK